MVTHVSPVAVQRGKTSEVTVQGNMDFSGVYKVLFDRPGITAEVLAGPLPTVPAMNPKRRGQPPPGAVKLKLTVAAGVPLGIRELRLASPRGISSVGQLLIVDDVVVQEKGNNNTPDRANPVALPCVICGRIEAAEDVDCYRFHADKGKTYTFEVFCARLEDRIHDLQKHADPLLAILDARGRELAANDDFYFADPLVSFTAREDADYFLEIRDSKYDGDPRWVYAILATNRPYITCVYPMAANPGQCLDVAPATLTGSTLGKVKLHAPGTPGVEEVQLDLGGVQSNPVPLIVSPLLQVLEIEPNDTPEQATPITIPCGINGRIAPARDLDHFRFAAAKGKAVRFEVKARRLGSVLHSSLDSVLDVMTEKGQILASNDDAIGKDSVLVFSPPADGDYILRIRDLNNKGGDTAVYFIEADWAQPDFTLRCDPDKAMIGPGSSTAWYVQVNRLHGFNAPVQVDVKGLPNGVTASPLTVPPSMNQGVVVLTAAADARPDAVNVEVMGTEVVKQPRQAEKTLQHAATPTEEIYFPGGGRGLFPVSEQTVAVTGPSDIQKVEVSPKVLRLKPGGEARIDVKVRRRSDFDKSVSLDVLMRHLGGVYGNPLPPGVTVVEGKSKTLLSSGSEGHITLKAAANAAAIEDVPIAVQAYVSINFVVKIGYASQPILLSVSKK
jgi:hypothetical protein